MKATDLPDSGEHRLYRAPGRVNIIGEHTDYTDGLVLPTTTAVYTWIAAAPGKDRVINIRSLNVDRSYAIDLDNIKRAPDGNWSNYAIGVVALLMEQGIELCGADLVLQSEIPIGGGLSSSAALEVAVATTLLDLNDESLDTKRLAQLCQQAEREYVGVMCGVMDQYAVAGCRHGHAMLLDCRDLSTQHVAIPDDIRLLLTDSGVKHALAAGKYNERATECTDGTSIIKQKIDGVESLRDVHAEDIDELRGALGDTLFRRCRHITSENQRVRDAYAAISACDSRLLGTLVSASHRSLRDDFVASCREVDNLVEIADQCDGVFGSRMVGGGFGGCVLSIVAVEKIDSVDARIRDAYRDPSGNKPWTHVVAPTDSAKRVLAA